MSTGTFDLPPVAAGLATAAMQVYVCRSDFGQLRFLPNVVCLEIEETWGATPAVARFRYLMDDAYAQSNGWPSRFEQLFPIDAAGPYVVQMDDRLAVLFAPPDSNPFIVFEGFAQIPQVDVNPASQQVTFVAISVAIRLWDQPIISRVQRDGDKDKTTDGSADWEIAAPCRFNPSDETVGGQGGYLGNCVAKPTHNESIGDYPVFLEPLLSQRGPGTTTYWFVSTAIGYLLTYMTLNLHVDIWVTFPTLSALQDLMAAKVPPGGKGMVNPANAVTSDIVVRDYDASNKAFPEVIEELLNYAGFVMAFKTGSSIIGSPETKLVILRRDALAAQAPKPVYLQAAFSPRLNPSANNVTAFSLVRDCNQIANDWYVETAPQQIEVTVWLCPLFQPDPADISNPQNFYSSALTNATATQRHKYRWYGADECGDGFWDGVNKKWVTGKGFDFGDVLFDDNGDANFVKRFRPGQGTLISRDKSGEPLKATLEVYFGASLDYPDFSPLFPLMGDNNSGWLTISHGWQLLDDRLGIEISIENPEQWYTGNPNVGDGGHIQAITWAAKPPDGKQFILRLTTVIDADADLGIEAPKRDASPTKYARARSADAKDHFQYCAIAPGSLNYLTQGGDRNTFKVMRDDTKAAQTHAEQLRSAHEFPTLAGTLTIPFLTTYYELGDRISSIQGRGCSLQTNIGVSQSEAPSYGWVVGRTLQCDPRQATVLQLSDLRAQVRNL
jgi:hypothetical protein